MESMILPSHPITTQERLFAIQSQQLKKRTDGRNGYIHLTDTGTSIDDDIEAADKAKRCKMSNDKVLSIINKCSQLYDEGFSRPEIHAILEPELIDRKGNSLSVQTFYRYFSKAVKSTSSMSIAIRMKDDGSTEDEVRKVLYEKVTRQRVNAIIRTVFAPERKKSYLTEVKKLIKQGLSLDEIVAQTGCERRYARNLRSKINRGLVK